jgi:hypothetical protein
MILTILTTARLGTPARGKIAFAVVVQALGFLAFAGRLAYWLQRRKFFG